MKTVKLLVLAAALVLSAACKKKEEAKKDPTAGSAGSAAMAGSGSAAPTPDPAGSAAMAGSAGSGAAMAGSGDTAGSAAMAGSAAGSAAAATPTEDTSDWVAVYATHVEKQPTDPVEVKFDKVKVVKANFDPKKIEGGTAQLEVDLTSLKSGDPKRDGHLGTPDYLDSAKFGTATIDISNVKKKDDKTYTADAKVKAHGVEKKLPVTFEVVEQKDDWVRVKGEAPIKRLDFKVGKKPGPDKKKDDGVADEMTVKLQVTLKKT